MGNREHLNDAPANPSDSDINPRDLADGAQELVRDWQLLFAAFLFFGFLRLAWMYFYRPENSGFNLGISCGFLFCGALGFLMRYVLSPKLRK